MKKNIILIFAISLFISCKKERKELNVVENDYANYINISDFFSQELLDSLMINRTQDYSKGLEGKSMNYRFHSTFYSKENIVKGAFSSDIYKYENGNNKTTFDAFTLGLKYELFDGNKLDFIKNDELKLNQKFYEIYDIRIKKSDLKGKLYIIGNQNVNICITFMTDSNLDIDLDKINQLLLKL